MNGRGETAPDDMEVEYCQPFDAPTPVAPPHSVFAGGQCAVREF